MGVAKSKVPQTSNVVTSDENDVDAQVESKFITYAWHLIPVLVNHM